MAINVASAEVLLAMKIRASRPRQDFADIAFLGKQAGVSTRDDALAVYDRYFPEDPLPHRAKIAIETIFAPPEASPGQFEKTSPPQARNSAPEAFSRLAEANRLNACSTPLPPRQEFYCEQSED